LLFTDLIIQVGNIIYIYIPIGIVHLITSVTLTVATSTRYLLLDRLAAILIYIIAHSNTLYVTVESNQIK